jgi:hypothetical protein
MSKRPALQKSDRKNAPEPRVVETPHSKLARKLLEMLLWVAGEHRHPSQRALIAEYLFANGFDLAARGRTHHDLAELKFRLVRLDRHARDARNSEWSDLFYEAAAIVEPPGEGGGCEF